MNCSAIKCDGFDAVCNGGPGSFWIDREAGDMYCQLPVGEGLLVRLRVSGEGSPRWALTGTEEKPTLSPSIHAVGTWHGYLTDGQFIEC